MFLAALLACSGESAQSLSAQAHLLEVEEWSRKRLQILDTDDGWLTLVGLAWLPEGRSTFGPHPSNDIVVPIESSLLSQGSFERTGAVVILTAEPGAALEADGAPVRSLELRTDEGGDPTVVRSGSMSFHLIARGDRIGVRMRDSENHAAATSRASSAIPRRSIGDSTPASRRPPTVRQSGAQHHRRHLR